MREQIRQFLCGMTGHDALPKFEKDRMFLLCTSCGHQSPGWDMNEVPPTPMQQPQARTVALVRPHLSIR